MINISEIKKLISNQAEIFFFTEIDSTNSEARRRINGGYSNDAIIIAEIQTAGRGRTGKSFYSESRGGLYFSVILHPEIKLSDATAITPLSAVATNAAIKKATKKDPKIKWVNDIYSDNKKICGILTEAITPTGSDRPSAIIIGIGINLSTDAFPDEISDIAGSIGVEIDRNILISEIFNDIKKYISKLPDKGFMDSYRADSLILGHEISFIRNKKSYIATAREIDDSCNLTVITAQGEKIILSSGEISIKPM